MVTGNEEIQQLGDKVSWKLNGSFARMLKLLRMVTKIRLVSQNIKTSRIQDVTCKLLDDSIPQCYL